MKEKTCCFTGHRDIKPADQRDLEQRLENTISALIQSGVCYFGAGGALGFDTMAAKAVLKLREVYPQVKLILVLPCLSQTRGWSEADIKVYEEIKAKADKITYTSQEYTRGCMHKRNRHLVDHSSVCVAYLTKETGGTAYTVDYAKKQGLRVINLGEPAEKVRQGWMSRLLKKN